MKKAVYLLLLLLLAVGLRLYPAVISGMPFSTDAWSPIRNTELLIQNTPVPLNDAVFDGYNNFWPANSLFGAVISQVTGLPPIEVMPLFFPIIGATAVLILFAIVKRFYNWKVAFIASLIFATAYSHVFFTAGVTKETYASPLYLVLIMVLLHPAIARSKQFFFFALASLTLALTHHFTALIVILILTSLAIGNFVNSLKKGVPPRTFDFVLVFIPTIVSVLYYGLFAQTGMAMPLNVAEWLSLASFQLLAFATVVYLMYKPAVNKNTRLLFIAVAASASALLYVILSLTTILIPSFTVSVQESALLYISPYFVALPFITLGFENQRGPSGKVAVLFWVAPLAALAAFAIFSNTAQGLSLWIRTPNFICIPAAVLTAVGLYWLYEKANGLTARKLVTSAIAAILIVITVIGIFSIYATVSLQDPNMGYHWTYSKQEFKAGSWLTEVTSNQTVTGDVKIVYLMRDYFGLKTNQLDGFRYLNGDTATQPNILFTYSQMQQNGYVIALHGLGLPDNWTDKTDQMNLVYSNELADVYAGVDTYD
ncbi:MAG: hypothetical protein NWF00_09515 [Candidatus Bathyarchaeota archaeon]|nr:hypothetical protein [Candidatus Bathyarchaeota archaeon]